MKSKKQNLPRRFGRLRPVAGQVLQWCIAGLQWTDMQRRLATEHGIQITTSALCVYATRHGFVRLHPYSTHYDPSLADKFSKGILTVEDLRETNTLKPVTNHETDTK